MEGPPKILPVIDPDVPPSIHPPIHPHLPQMDGPGGGALLLMISPVKTGKSTIISNLMLNENFYNAQERFDTVSVISNTIANDVTSRFMRKAFDTHDHYNDMIIDDIITRQKSFDKDDQPEIAIVLDDCLGSIKREARVNHLASRFRHFNIKLLIISSQNFRAVSPVIRQNATNVIIGSPFPNQKELGKVAEEYGDLFGGSDNFLRSYHQSTPNRYDFCYMDLQANPPVMYHNFESVVAVGGTGHHENPEESKKDDSDKKPIDNI
jgi:hypothetical protein